MTQDPITQLIAQLKAAGETVGFTVSAFAHVGPQAQWPLLGMTRAASHPSPQTRHIYLSAGIHGDEPAPPQALLELLKSDALPHFHHYYICPLLNPSGLALGTRENAAGLDLNRDYRDFLSEEIRNHVQWIDTHIPQIDCALHLHEDWESHGFYLYELNFHDQSSNAQRILTATQQHLPTETATEIDGYPAQGGIIHLEASHQLETGQAEALYLQQKFDGVNYTLETPSALELRCRVDALKAAVLNEMNAILAL
jgi:predicted deacylase